MPCPILKDRLVSDALIVFDLLLRFGIIFINIHRGGTQLQVTLAPLFTNLRVHSTGCIYRRNIAKENKNCNTMMLKTGFEFKVRGKYSQEYK